MGHKGRHKQLLCFLYEQRVMYTVPKQLYIYTRVALHNIITTLVYEAIKKLKVWTHYETLVITMDCISLNVIELRSMLQRSPSINRLQAKADAIQKRRHNLSQAERDLFLFKWLKGNKRGGSLSRLVRSACFGRLHLQARDCQG